MKPILGIFAAVSCLAACTTDSETAGTATGRSTSVLAMPEPSIDGAATTTYVDARPAALVDGRSVTWGELRAGLTEAAGAEALEETILDRRLARLLADAGLEIGEDDIAVEQRLLVESLHPDPDTAFRLLEELRTRRGLGPDRFRRLLERNASLRKLVADRVVVDAGEIDRVYELLYGERRQIRIITVPSLSAATLSLDRIRAGESFADVALDVSTDGSAMRGGVLPAMSRADRSYPEILRTTVWSMRPGDLSSPILLDDQYAVVRLERIVPGEAPPRDEVGEQLERMARAQQERVLMEQTARRLLEDTSVTIFDDSLQDSWRRRRAATAGR